MTPVMVPFFFGLLIFFLSKPILLLRSGSASNCAICCVCPTLIFKSLLGPAPWSAFALFSFVHFNSAGNSWKSRLTRLKVTSSVLCCCQPWKLQHLSLPLPFFQRCVSGIIFLQDKLSQGVLKLGQLQPRRALTQACQFSCVGQRHTDPFRSHMYPKASTLTSVVELGLLPEDCSSEAVGVPLLLAATQRYH